jgi:hypothetical protein
MYYFVLNKMVKSKIFKIIIVFLLSLIVYFESKVTIFRLPWGMEIGIMVLLFYGL